LSKRSRDDAEQAVLLADDVDRVDRLGVVADLADQLDDLADGEVDRARDVVGGHQAAGRVLRPLGELFDLGGGLGIDLLERLEEAIAHRLGQALDEVGPLVGGHLADDRRDALEPHPLDDRLLGVVVEALEDRRRVLGLEAREDERRLVVVQHPEEVGEVLVVDLLEQIAELRRVLGEELSDLRHDGGSEAQHGGGGYRRPPRRRYRTASSAPAGYLRGVTRQVPIAAPVTPAEAELRSWIEEFEAAARRPLRQRLRYAFIHTYKPVLDDAAYRSSETTAEYRAWCEANLPSWLGYGRSV
jgi:hypothetical protein